MTNKEAIIHIEQIRPKKCKMVNGKFRTVSSILVIAEFTIPLLAMLTLKKIVDEPEVLTKKIKFVYLSFALTAGVALLFALMPNVFFDFVSQADMQNFTKSGIPQEYLQDVANNIGRMRVPIFTSDCWRTLQKVKQ